jgi:ParB family transcriptional regulator, chromosome partitioning protein
MSTSPSETPSEIRLVELEISAIDPNPRNPRLLFPEEELNRLAESIDLEGILVPITVFQKDDRFTLVDGERRFRCAKELGLETVPALVVDEKPEHDVLVQMFNIHMVREPWRDIPTAKALGRLAEEITTREGAAPSDAQLRDITGLSIERVRRLRYVLTLPEEWQRYINEETIPLNFFWELKRNVVDVLAARRPGLLTELGGDQAVAKSFVDKRLDGVLTDTVGLRKVRPIINFAAEDAESHDGQSFLDDTIRDLVRNPERSIDDAYEDTVQIMVEADKLESRTKTMVTSFERLLGKARTDDDRAYIKRIGQNLILRLRPLVEGE